METTETHEESIVQAAALSVGDIFREMNSPEWKSVLSVSDSDIPGHIWLEAVSVLNSMTCHRLHQATTQVVVRN